MASTIAKAKPLVILNLFQDPRRPNRKVGGKGINPKQVQGDIFA
tara:strand:+ start:1026 stop:1157 length:132 start_codon:yes stop_codon:yes gene_type:complete